MAGIAHDVTELIGNTPLVRLNRMSDGLDATVVAKLESFNPLSSVKDRIGVSMIDAAEREGRIAKDSDHRRADQRQHGHRPGLCLRRAGLPAVLTMPDSVSAERRQLLKAFGAEIVLTPGAEGMNGAIQKAEEIVATNPKALHAAAVQEPGQPGRSTARPPPRRSGATPTARSTSFVAGVGTGGTITGVAEVLKQRKPSFKVIAVEPATSPVLSGGQPGPHRIQGIGAGFIPEVLRVELIDEVVRGDGRGRG